MIEEKLKNITTGPGVYLLKNAKGKILYIGKAKALRARLRSHFKPGRDEDARHHALMRGVTEFDTIVTDSEVEALILEANLVKEHKPRYNVNLKDDKSYPYIRVTNETFPRIFITRKIVKDGSQYFGPYTDVGTMRRIMSGIRRIFPIRTCQLQITEKTIRERKHKVCLNYHIGKCRGPCEGFISVSDYQWIVDQVVLFIQGKDERVIRAVREQMEERAADKRYEDAAVLRDQIRLIEGFRDRQKFADASFADRDILAVASQGRDAVGVVFNVRDGKVVNRQHFQMNAVDGVPDSEVMDRLLKQAYIKSDTVPGEILLSSATSDAPPIESWLTEKRGGRVRLLVPQRGDKAKLVALCRKNAGLLLAEIRIQRERAAEKPASSVAALKDDLGLKQPPKRIEAFDISNIQGTDSVASLVVFENGKPKKSEYRKYRIKTVEGADDFASMAEVVERRFTRLLNEDRELPDLVLVDGGKGQLSSAVSVLARLGIEDQPIIGLAKRLEEVFVPGLSDPQNIPKHSPGLHLLQHLRDEAHRFAVSYHRQRRRKRTIHSELDDIPGIGEKRRNALLKAFGSVEAIRKASVEEVTDVEGMNRKLAEELKKFLSKVD